MSQDSGLTSSNEYQVINEIGHGGFSRVRLVKRNSDAVRFVIKEIKLSTVNDNDRLVELVKQEPSLMVGLRHPNIVTVFGHFTENNIFSIVMEYCEDGDLQQEIYKKRKDGAYFDEETIQLWIGQLALTLRFVHDKKILHRDIKANNIFLSSNKKLVKLGDFGIAKVVELTEQGGTTRISTPTYESPEFVRGKPYTAKSEAWAFGVLAYFLTTLDLPFPIMNGNKWALAKSIKSKTFKPIPGHFSSELHDFIDRLLTKDPNWRMSIAESVVHPFLLPAITNAMVVSNAPKPRKSLGLRRSNIAPETIQQTIAQVLPSYSELFHAIERGDVVFIKATAALTDGCSYLASVRKDDETNDTLLHFSMRHCQSAVTHFLLDSNGLLLRLFDVNAKNEKGNAAIHLAATRGFNNAIALLAAAGAELNLLGAGGESLGLVKEANDKLYYTASQRWYNEGLQDPALHQATQLGLTSTVAMLLQHGADINARDSFGELAIHVAARAGYDQLVTFFLEQGLSIEAKGKFGRTPLLRAVEFNRADVIRSLKPRKPDVAAVDEEGNSALSIAGYFGCVDMVTMLIDEFGVDLESRGKSGRTPFLCAASNGNVEAATFLKNKGADLSAMTRNGNCALNLASYFAGVKMVKVLIEDWGFSIETKGHFGRTPLHCAAEKNNVKVAKFLISSGANLKAQDDDCGDTALCLAAYFGSEDVARALLESGRDVGVSVKNKLGQTALDLAIKKKRFNIVAILKRYE